MAWGKPQGVVAAELLRHNEGLGNGHLDLDRVTDALGIDVVGLSWPDNPIMGKYIRRRGRAFVMVNTAMPFTRQRFTIAHEIGHHCLAPQDGDLEVVDDHASMYSKDNPERQANLFASALLMDERGVRDTVEEIRSREPNAMIAEVVRTFEVSLEAAAIRLSELGLIDGQVCTDFLGWLKESKANRSSFMGQHGLGIREDRWRYETRLPAHFSRRARALHEAGVLSDARTEEILNRPKPPVEA